MDRIRQIKQIAQKIRRRYPERWRRPRPPGRHCSTGRRGGLGPGAPAAARRRKAPRRRRAARSRPSEGADDQRADRKEAAAKGRWSARTGVAVLAVAAVCALLGGFAAFAATLGGPAPGPAPRVHRPRGRDRHARPRWDRHRPERRRHRSERRRHRPGGTQPGSPDPSLTPLSEPTGQPTAGPASADHADPFSAAVTGYLAGRAGTVLAADLRLPHRADLGPRQRAPAADRQPGQGRHPADAARPAAARPVGGRPGARPFHDRKQRSTPPRPSCGTRSAGRPASAPTTRPSACSRPRPRRAWSARASAGRAGA